MSASTPDAEGKRLWPNAKVMPCSKRVLDPNCVAALNRTGRLPTRFYLENLVAAWSPPSRPITVQFPPPGVDATATWRIGE